MSGIHVLAAPLVDPGTARVELTVAAGLTVADILALALPGAPPPCHLRVLLVTAAGATEILPAFWRQVRPRPGVRVVIRVLAGRDALKSVLMIAVAVAAFAIGQWWAVSVLGLSGFAASAVATGVSIGVSVVGQLLVNALIPPVKPRSLEAQNRYSISGWRNELRPDGAIPDVMGAIRYAPPFAALSHSEIVGDWQYVRAVFLLGIGEIEATDFRIGETSLSEYDEVEIEVRTGRADDLPLSLYPRQIVEESVGADLAKPLPRDDLGEVISGAPATEKPVVRTTGADASGASVILAWPAGLIRYNDKGGADAHTVSVRIEQRLVQAEEWQPVVVLDINARKLEAFYRQHSWDFPSRGRWQVRVTMQTDETTDSKIQQRTTWAALQTIRPEYPLAYHHPLALVALRVKATHQLNGQLDNINCVVSRVCLDWDAGAGSWVRRATSNPASVFRHALQSGANPRPVTDAGIDLAALADWHAFCEAKSLKYDRVLDDTGSTLRDILTEVAAAGRAAPRHDGLKWSVVIDRPQDLVVDHISPRNSWAFRARRDYIQPPHAMRVRFLDATNDHKPAERFVRWPGYEGDITLTEELAMPGVCWPDQVYLGALRRMYEAIYRPDAYEAMQSGLARVATRGDLVRVSQDVLSEVQKAARVVKVSGTIVEIDEPVTMDTGGGGYAIRFRSGLTAEDTLGVSVVRTVQTWPGTGHLLTLTGPGPLPSPGDIVHFGTAAALDYALVVRGVEAGDGNAALYRFVDAAPVIDELIDATVPPAWSGRAGAEIPENVLAPAMPRFTSVRSGLAGDGVAGRIRYLLTPGSGVVPAATYEVEHRATGTTDWTSASIPVANGGGAITVYASGAGVDLRARAVSAASVPGPYTATVSLVVGAGDVGIPADLPAAGVAVSPLLGGASIAFRTSDDVSTAQVQVYRSTSATLDRATDAVGAPHQVEPSRRYTVVIGDDTRENLLSGVWITDAGWSAAGATATHTAGTADAASQALTIAAGRWCRLGFTLSDISAGSVTPRLAGGSVRPGAAQAEDGFWADRIQAVTGNDRLEWLADSAFAGTVSGAVAYVETGSCLLQGTHYIWLEAQNTDGIPGPAIGPYTVRVI